MFSIVDISTGGLGLDVAGAIVLARGVLLSRAEVVAQVRPGLSWSNTQDVERLIRDAIAGWFGVVLLGLGFMTQLTGYAVALGVTRSATVAPGWGAAGVSVAFAVVFAVLGVSGYGLSHTKLENRRIVAQASLGPRTGVRRRRPYASELRAFGQYRKGQHHEPDEPLEAYARRAWGVRDVDTRPPDAYRDD